MCVLFCVRVSTRLWMSECVWNEGGICCCSLGRLKKSTKRQVKTGNRRRSGITKEDTNTKKNQDNFWWGGPCVDGESEIAGLRRWQRWNGDSMAARSASSALVDGRRPCRDFCPFLQSKFGSPPPPPSSTYPSFKRIRLFYCLVFFLFLFFLSNLHTCRVVGGGGFASSRISCFLLLWFLILPYLDFRLNQSR